MFFYKVKKGISKVISTSLLIVVSIVVYISFQTWFIDYFTSLENSINQKDINNINYIRVIDSIMYLSHSFSYLNISEVSIDGISCNKFGSYNTSLVSIPINSCYYDSSNEISELVVLSNQGIFSSSFLNSNLNKNILNCSSLSGGNWILVPGNLNLGTKDFCIMKYEAKATPSSIPNLGIPSTFSCGSSCPIDGSVNITSIPEYTPLNRIRVTHANSLCENLGSGYSLQSVRHYMTIANNIITVKKNWINNQIGGKLYVGNTDGGYSGLNASVNDSQGYYLMGDTNSSCDSFYSGFPDSSEENILGLSCAGQRRTFYLDNGEVIWDLSGNSQELTLDVLAAPSKTSFGFSSEGTKEWSDFNLTYLNLGNFNLNTSNGAGLFIIDTTPESAYHMVRLGGEINNGLLAGLFAGNVNRAANSYHSGSSVRCIYEN